VASNRETAVLEPSIREGFQDACSTRIWSEAMTRQSVPSRRCAEWLLPALFAAVCLWSRPAAADVVVPGPDVTTRVVVHASGSAQSAQVASLTAGQQMDLLGSVPNWYEVRLPSGGSGSVSKRWTRNVSSEGRPPAGGAAAARSYTIDVLDVGTGLSVLVRGADFAERRHGTGPEQPRTRVSQGPGADDEDDRSPDSQPSSSGSRR